MYHLFGLTHIGKPLKLFIMNPLLALFLFIIIPAVILAIILVTRKEKTEKLQETGRSVMKETLCNHAAKADVLVGTPTNFRVKTKLGVKNFIVKQKSGTSGNLRSDFDFFDELGEFVEDLIMLDFIFVNFMMSDEFQDGGYYDYETDSEMQVEPEVVNDTEYSSTPHYEAENEFAPVEMELDDDDDDDGVIHEIETPDEPESPSVNTTESDYSSDSDYDSDDDSGGCDD